MIFKNAGKRLIKDMKYVKWVILFVIAYFTLLRRFFYSVCPVVLITGFPCPGCGMTRAAFRLLHFDFFGAWKVHPFIYPLILVFLLFVYQRYFTEKSDMKTVKTLTIVVALGMLVFYIWRMWKYFPGDAPMSYYYGSVLYRLKRMIPSEGVSRLLLR